MLLFYIRSNRMDHLPNELMAEIIKYLTPEETIKLGNVDKKRINLIINYEPYWNDIIKEICDKTYPRCDIFFLDNIANNYNNYINYCKGCGFGVCVQSGGNTMLCSLKRVKKDVRKTLCMTYIMVGVGSFLVGSILLRCL